MFFWIETLALSIHGRGGLQRPLALQAFQVGGPKTVLLEIVAAAGGAQHYLQVPLHQAFSSSKGSPMPQTSMVTYMFSSDGVTSTFKVYQNSGFAGQPRTCRLARKATQYYLPSGPRNRPRREGKLPG